MTELEEFRKPRMYFSRELRSFSRRRQSACIFSVRTAGLTETMLRYLTRRIEENPRIVLRTKTEIVALEGRRMSSACGGAMIRLKFVDV